MDLGPMTALGKLDPESLITGGIVLFFTTILGGIAIL